MTAVPTIVLVMLLVSPAFAQDSPRGSEREAGQLVFNNACRTCHTVRDGDNRLGPHLHAIIGRKAGSLPDFGYSPSMAGADIKWDKSTLDRFIANPDAVVPGNNMKPYPGIASPEDRSKVIAFLEETAR